MNLEEEIQNGLDHAVSTQLESQINSRGNIEISVGDVTLDGKDETLSSQSNANRENVADDNKSDESDPVGSGTSNDPITSKQTPPKGYGLRKWRRVRRDSVTDGSFSAESGLILKRRLPTNELLNSRGEQHKLKNVVDLGEKDDVASVESQNVVPTLYPDLSVLVDSVGFSIGADSENSDERSSRVSTAASGPRMRHENIGFGRERSRARNVAQSRSQRGRGGVEQSKKYRGGKIRFEKENSHSSVESDLRSTNAAFSRWGSLSTNGKHGHTDDAQASEEVRSRYFKENGEAANLSKDELDGDCLEKENSRNGDCRVPRLDIDPFVESIAVLKATQEALENEIQRFAEIGKPPASVGDYYDQYEETEGSSSPLNDAYFIELNQKIDLLERKLEEASTELEAKQSRVLELEAMMSSLPSAKEVRTDVHFHEKIDDVMNTELEDMMKKRMEAEIVYLILSRKAQNLKILAEDQMALLHEHKSLAEDQIWITSKLRDAENKIIMLERHAKELDASCMEFLEVEEVLKLQSRVCNLSISSFVQLVVLFIALGVFIMRLLPPSDGVVPT